MLFCLGFLRWDGGCYFVCLFFFLLFLLFFVVVVFLFCCLIFFFFGGGGLLFFLPSVCVGFQLRLGFVILNSSKQKILLIYNVILTFIRTINTKSKSSKARKFFNLQHFNFNEQFEYLAYISSSNAMA